MMTYAALVLGAGGQAPHRCTAQSASDIARQIDPAWIYKFSMRPDDNLRCGPVETRTHDVVTPTGPKRIEARYQCGMLLLRCPYTAEQFVFGRGAGTGAGLAGEMQRLYLAEARDAAARGHASEAGRLREAATRVGSGDATGHGGVDAGQVGVSRQGDGSYAFDASKVTPNGAAGTYEQASGAIGALADRCDKGTTAEINACLDKQKAAALSVIAQIGNAVGAAFGAPGVGNSIADLLGQLPWAKSGGSCCDDNTCGPDRYSSGPPADVAGAWRKSRADIRSDGNTNDYGDPAAGSFERYAYALLLAGWAASFAPKGTDRCTWTQIIPTAPAILATAITQWNATHDGPTRRVTRDGLARRRADGGTGFWTPHDNDPISWAMNDLIVAASDGQNKEDPSWGPGEPGSYRGASASFAINDGPALVAKQGVINPGHVIVGGGGGGGAAASAATKAVVGAAVVVGASALGIGALALAKGLSYSAAADLVWGAIKRGASWAAQPMADVRLPGLGS